MTYEQCLADARALKAHMGRYRVPCSIELIPGRGPDPWASIHKLLRMHHHVASYYVPTGSKTPLLGLVKQGRSDLPGPLANGYGGFDLVYRIITMGMANHSGLGGPITIDGVTVPANSGRGPTWGTEFEGGYQDWINIPGMLEFMGRCDNALADWSGRPITSQLEHSTWAPGRKSDRKSFTRASGIELTKKYRTPTTPTAPPESVGEDDVYTLIESPNGTVYMNVNGDLIHMNGVGVLDQWIFTLKAMQNDINARRATAKLPKLQILFYKGEKTYGDGKLHAAGYPWPQTMVDSLFTG